MNQLKTVTLKGLDGTGFFVGEYVTISSKTKSTNLQFNYTRVNDSFEDVMSYYHIDTLQRYIQGLGFKNINNRSIKVNGNGTTDDNSFYSRSRLALSRMNMGIRFKITMFLTLVVQQKAEQFMKIHYRQQGTE